MPQPQSQDVPMETDPPVPKEARQFWQSMGPEVESRAKKARVMAIAVSSRQQYDTVDEESPVATVDLEEVIDDGPADLNVTVQHQRAEIKNLEEFDTFEVTPLSQVDKVNGKFISARFVDAEEKSRFVSREFRGGEVANDHYAPGATQPTQRFVDYVAAKRGHARLSAGFSGAFLHVIEDELIYVDPPKIWIEDRRGRGLDINVVWRMKSDLWPTQSSASLVRLFGRSV